MVQQPDRAPVLIHIGYHKTGTNWLQRHYFGDPRTGTKWVEKSGGDHPVRLLVQTRPLEFDAAASRRSSIRCLRCRNAGTGPGRLVRAALGPPFSGGHESKEMADRLRQVFPRRAS